MDLDPTFISIIRNIRGVLYLAPGNWNEKIVKWLKRKYRYRKIGIAPYIEEKFKEYYNILGQTPFKKLEYPTIAVKEFAKKLLDSVDYGDVVESLVLASCYVTPIVTDEKGIKRLKNSSIFQIYSEKSLPEKEILRHLRIVNYTILDSHEELCWNAYKKISTACHSNGKEIVEKLIKERTAFARKDSKRYWRFKTEKGELIVLYLDILKILEKLPSYKSIICKFIESMSISLIFGVVPAIKVEV